MSARRHAQAVQTQLGYETLAGMATEANLRRLRQSQRPYLCAMRRAVVRQYLPAIRSGVWIVVQTTQAQEPAIAVQELIV